MRIVAQLALIIVQEKAQEHPGSYSIGRIIYANVNGPFYKTCVSAIAKANN